LVLRLLGGGTYDKDRLVREMRFLRPPSSRATMLKALPAQPLPLPHEGATVLESVRARGSLRVGFNSGAIPYSYFNDWGEFVGFDVRMAHLLAEELGVALEFVPVPVDRFVEVLNAGQCDLVIGGIIVTTNRASEMTFSPPYMDETLAFIVPDRRRVEFSSMENIRDATGLRVAVPNLPDLLAVVRRALPLVEVVPVTNPDDYLTGKLQGVDALIWTAERGSLLTLLHPAFSVAVPHPLSIRIPLAYPVARKDVEFARFLGLWIDLKRKDGTIQQLYDHWILGRDAQSRAPRWSVLRNVLHWTK